MEILVQVSCISLTKDHREISTIILYDNYLVSKTIVNLEMRRTSPSFLPLFEALLSLIVHVSWVEGFFCTVSTVRVLPIKILSLILVIRCTCSGEFSQEHSAVLGFMLDFSPAERVWLRPHCYLASRPTY